MTELPRVRPFSCGSQYGDWMDSNCMAGCAKTADPDNPLPRCPCAIEQALLEAYCGDGTVSAGIARRMGRRADEDRYGWPCPEHDPPWVKEE